MSTAIMNAAFAQDFLAGIIAASHEVLPPEDRESFDLVDTATFLEMDFQLQWLVNGLLVRNQPCIIGAPRKTMKTNLCVALAVSLATGRAFLGNFPVPNACRVGLFSGESGGATIRETYSRICQALFIEGDDIQEIPIFWGFSLPQLANGDHLTKLSEMIKENELEVVIIDPVYLSLMGRAGNVNMANLFDVGPLLSTISRSILDAGATPILVHHTQKRQANPGEPLELEALAFAGFQEFARQWMLISRREKYDPDSGEHKLWLNAGGSAGFGGGWAVDIDEGRLNNEFGGRRWSVTVHTAAEARQALAVQKERGRTEKEQEKVREDCRKVRDYLSEQPDGDTLNAIIEMTGLSRQRVKRAIPGLLERHEIEKCHVEKEAGRGGPRPYDGYRIVVPSRSGIPGNVPCDGVGDMAEGDSGEISDCDDAEEDQYIPEDINDFEEDEE